MISKSFSSQHLQPSRLLIFRSHCPWINNCVGNNNLRHFLLYLVFMEVGIIIFIRLVLICETALFLSHYSTIPISSAIPN